MKVRGYNEKFIKEVIKEGFITNTRFYECEDDNGYMEVKERGITYVSLNNILISLDIKYPHQSKMDVNILVISMA